jgi:hypothetical protein
MQVLKHHKERKVQKVMKKMGFLMIFSSLLFLNHVYVAAQTERSDIADEYKWDLTDLYESDKSWDTRKNQIAAKLDSLLQFKVCA